MMMETTAAALAAATVVFLTVRKSAGLPAEAVKAVVEAHVDADC